MASPLPTPTTGQPCTRCHKPIAALYPTRIVGEPYHADCARDEERERMHLLACERCLDLFAPEECVLLHGEHAIYCLECWQAHYPHEDATLMRVVIAEQNRGGDE